MIPILLLCLSGLVLGDTTSADIHPKCFKPSYQVSTSRDLHEISDCHVISGSINIHGFDSDLLDLGSISQIKGDLKISNASQILRVEALELESIDGSFQLNTLTSLTSASFPKLQSVNTLDWRVLPILSSVNLDTGIKRINSVIMSDTSLTGFGGFNVDTLKTLKIDNNRFLERIDSSVKEISGDLIIAANARNLKVSLPELKWVKTAMIKDTEEVNLDELQVVQSSAEFIENHFTDLKLPKLKSTGTTLSLIDNKRLERAEFPSLVEVGGGLMVINNNKLNQIDFFSQLKSVGGAIELEGDIDENKFKQLKVVKGSAIMKSSSNKFDCKDWVDNEVSSVVRGGKIECGSGDSEFTEVIHLDESGERTSRSTGRNSAKTSKNGSSIIDSSGVGGNSDMLSLGMALVVVAGIVIG